MDPTLTPGDHTPFPHQIAGHPGVMSDPSGGLLIKPALPREIAFYQMLSNSDPEDIVWPLRKFVPKNYGTLRLEGRLGAGGAIETDLDMKNETPESVVLENLAYAYTRPNIMDVKLGTVLHAPYATDEKRQRMEKQARETTTHETGIRLTGCQTWHAPTQGYISTPKSFGKSITTPELSLGMVRFFPLPTDSIPCLVAHPSPPPTAVEVVSNIEASHLPIPDEASCASVIQSATSISIPIPPPTPISPEDGTTATTTPASTDLETLPTYKDHSIPPRTLARLLTLLLQKLDYLTEAISNLEMRFVGASLLIVYEGDPVRLEAALDREEKVGVKGGSDGKENGNGDSERSMFSDDGSIDSDSDEDEDDEYDSDEEEGYDSEDDLDGKKKDERRARKCPALTLKMIDFAHTWLAQGEGPDEGVLKGLRTFKSLVERRLEEVERSCM
ncbi:arginine metabolism transcriptional control protein [Cryptococcus gattii E566]|uniref:Kinase n=2 Tax=Cryptococcus gattii TaxID=37769 RepID=E6RFN3_CRYGW|nr:Arginine metabolism transcriptional control protein, putative [Cryptococcus gattii WM276]ADV25821.1 Arginine metabolism transcriptional control protein, putative [Cryptococcus gattii WM276]KIR77991.1 arginine metabolism transcriptional control protein [Cryptococcus gattii EJB2]KIY36935.1 arginine metabolism transcriptional control protein [Cryptococcus gattii E566]KJE00595.1 arginine metabolism transcriptional control protein [Cryptococcus gattii NT-10]